MTNPVPPLPPLPLTPDTLPQAMQHWMNQWDNWANRDKLWHWMITCFLVVFAALAPVSAISSVSASQSQLSGNVSPPPPPSTPKSGSPTREQLLGLSTITLARLSLILTILAGLTETARRTSKVEQKWRHFRHYHLLAYIQYTAFTTTYSLSTTGGQRGIFMDSVKQWEDLQTEEQTLYFSL
jgi:hypothetical protein